MSDGPDAWGELQTLFDLIDRTPEAEQQRVLDAACTDTAMRARVLRMVRGANQDGDSSTGPTAPPDAGSPGLGSAGLPSQLGPYQVLRVIGSGGIGTVYLAERFLGGAPQRVAIKVLSPHAAGQRFVERFHREQHILSMLDHANITRLLDAGLSETGQPYLVMDFVEGVHLDQYCDRESLNVEARVRLFLQVCEAIAHAHRNLVVHLDLKPSNILVNAEGSVKLLDFGTSKLVQPDDSVTTTILATPAYASPEQLRNEPVTTACDIYSLGVVLFFLLTGQVEGGRRSAAIAMERAFNETQPQHLAAARITEEAARTRATTASRLKWLLRGDIDTIVAKCLQPLPKDRYASVDALEQDLVRYLEGRAILARPQTLLYLGSKFLRRHALSAGFMSLLVVALLATGLLASWRQREALHEAERSLRMQTYMYRLFKMANPQYTGKPVATVPDFLRAGLAKLPDYIHDPADLRTGQLALAESMYDSGSLDEALAAFAVVKESASRARATADLTESELFIGEIDCQQGHVADGRAILADALSRSNNDAIPWRLRVLAKVYYAWNEDNNGFRTDENLSLLRTAVKEADERGLAQRDVEFALYYLAMDLYIRGQESRQSQFFNSFWRSTPTIRSRSAIAPPSTVGSPGSTTRTAIQPGVYRSSRRHMTDPSNVKAPTARMPLMYCLTGPTL
jgi:serine/threonine-protein kinase